MNGESYVDAYIYFEQYLVILRWIVFLSLFCPFPKVLTFSEN